VAERKARTERASRAEEPNVLFTPQDADRALEAMLTSADERRADALDTLELVQRARATLLERGVERLDARTDPAAEALAAAAEATNNVAQRLRVEAARARVEEPAPAEEVTKVHGHVLDEGLEPVEGATVHVLDKNGRRVRGASTTTDPEGYFVLEWAPPARRGAEAEPEVRLRVTTGSSRVLHEERTPQPRATGAVEYREIVVPKERG
jgi:hypothetical protein